MVLIKVINTLHLTRLLSYFWLSLNNILFGFNVTNDTLKVNIN